MPHKFYKHDNKTRFLFSPVEIDVTENGDYKYSLGFNSQFEYAQWLVDMGIKKEVTLTNK